MVHQICYVQCNSPEPALPLAVETQPGSPPAPKDVILLPLSNTELDVEIVPSDTVRVPMEPTGEPTRYNISYEFRVWKKKTNVQEIKIRQVTGIVISFMRMHAPPVFSMYEQTPMKLVDYVYGLMGNHTSDTPAPLNTCEQNICSYGLKKLDKFKNEVISTYDNVYHGFSHFAPSFADDFLSNTWEIKMNGKFAKGAILAINKKIVSSKIGVEINEEGLLATFEIDNGWNLLEFYGFESCCQRTVMSMKYRKKTKNDTWTEWNIWGKETLAMTGTRPSFSPYRNVRHLRNSGFLAPKSKFRVSYNSLFTNFMPFNATSETVFQALHNLNTTGHLMVSRIESTGQDLCTLAG